MSEPSTTLQAPFPWFGGKSRAGAEIWAALGEVKNYVEPFCGSLAALLTSPRIHHTETVNDADGFVANFWRSTSMDPEAVAHFADWPVNECCPAGTMIATPDGDIPIEQVRPGTVVWGEVSGRIVPTEVLGTRRSLASEFVTVGPLRVTPNHPVWTQERGYLEAKSLTAGLHVAIVDAELRTAKLAVLQSADDQPCGASREDSPLMHKSQACGVHGDGGSVRLSHARFDGAGRLGGVGQPGHPEGRPVPGDALPLRVEVFNFQTTSANYIANGVLVHNCDLEARHAWLVARSERLRWCLQDPEFFDAKIAGWWVWGQCSWIGTGWCSGEGPHKHDGAHFSGNAGRGINRKLPHLGNAGRGINRKLPHLGDAGRGINRKLPHLGDAGRGVSDYIAALSERLRRTRVACGDWGRVVTPVCTWRHGLTGVFLDPPYGEGTMDYSAGGNTSSVAADVWSWAVENGSHEKMRIVVAAYEDGREVPKSWTVRPWRARKGYKADGGANARREVLYCSPGCLSPAQSVLGQTA